MPEQFTFDQSKRLSPGWNLNRMHVGKALTDRKIREYEKKGFYTADFKESRRSAFATMQKWLKKNGI